MITANLLQEATVKNQRRIFLNSEKLEVADVFSLIKQSLSACGIFPVFLDEGTGEFALEWWDSQEAYNSVSVWEDGDIYFNRHKRGDLVREIKFSSLEDLSRNFTVFI